MTYTPDVHGTLRIRVLDPSGSESSQYIVTFEEYGSDHPEIRSLGVYND